jgi:hypothetical protein
MKNKPQDERDWHQRRIEDARQRAKTSAPAAGPSAKSDSTGPRGSAKARKAVSNRQKKPGHAGLANESRPGLGTRNDDPDPAHMPEGQTAEGKQHGRPKATMHGYEEPRPEPREQTDDPLTRDEERSTGVSGHMGNT